MSKPIIKKLKKDTIAKIIAVVNNKGGVGKTSSVINIASKLANEKLKVLVVDLDQQANAAGNCGIDEDDLDYTSFELLAMDEVTAEDCIFQTEKGFDVISGSINLANITSVLAVKMNREKILYKKFKPIMEKYDYIILDCPASFDVTTMNALAIANLALIPLTLHKFSVKGINNILNFINVIKQEYNETLEHKFFATQFDGRINSFKKIDNSLRVALETDFLETKIRLDNQIKEAQNEDKTVFEIKNCKGSEDYAMLVKEVFGV